MKLHTVAADKKLAGITIETGEELVLLLKHPGVLRPEAVHTMSQCLAKALPGTSVVVLCDGLDVLPLTRPLNTATRTPAVTETRDAAPARAFERRTLHASEVRVEKDADGNAKLIGYAAVFNELSQPLTTRSGKKFVEKIAPGAFTDTLAAGADISMLYAHDPNKVLARTSSSTLTLRQDDKGLAFEAALADTSHARDCIADIEHKNIRGMSFGFGDPEDAWERGEDGTAIRTLKSVSLGEISATPFPAYEGTSVDVRSIERALGKLEITAAPTSVSVKRATIEIEDDSLIWVCRCGIDYLRLAFDSAQSVMDTASRVTGDLSDRDQTAIDDYLDQLTDLVAKARRCKAVLAALGAVDEGAMVDETKNDPPAMDEAATMRSLKMAAEARALGLTPEEMAVVLAPSGPPAK